MKRPPDTTDAEWDAQINERAEVAKRRLERADNMKGFTTLKGISKAARAWYGNISNDSQTLAENRLVNGELP